MWAAATTQSVHVREPWSRRDNHPAGVKPLPGRAGQSG
jgi:hypothetical protein